MDKCVTVQGTKSDPKNYQVQYDFFCLESTGKVLFVPTREGLYRRLYAMRTLGKHNVNKVHNFLTNSKIFVD